MARKKTKQPTQGYPTENGPPLNMSDDIEDLQVHLAGCLTVSQDPLIGTFTVLTKRGHYDFVINEALANEMIQALREFIAGDSVNLVDDE